MVCVDDDLERDVLPDSKQNEQYRLFGMVLTI